MAEARYIGQVNWVQKYVSVHAEGCGHIKQHGGGQGISNEWTDYFEDSAVVLEAIQYLVFNKAAHDPSKWPVKACKSCSIVVTRKE